MFRQKPYFNTDAGATPPAGGTPPGAAGASGGAGDQGTPNPEVAELQTLTTKDATTLTEVEKTRLTELQGKYEVVLKDDKGNPLTKEQVDQLKAEEKKFNDILAKPEEQRTQEEKDFLKTHAEEEKDERTVYQKVDEFTGVPYEIDYEGIDPMSIEGIARREQVIKEQAAKEYDRSLKTKYPRAYQYMLHLSQGGKEEDFFKPENQDFLSLTLKKDDPTQQERVLRTALAAKGNSPAIIDAAVAALKDGQLYETAKTELEALQAVQKQREQQRETQIAERKRKEDQDIDQFSKQVDDAIVKGFDGVVIPQVDREKFAKFVYDQLDYHNGNFLVVKKIEPKELSKVLKTAYFEFKGGDLKGLVDRAAATKNALKFKSAVKTEIVPKGSAGAPTKRVPLGSL